MRIDMRFIAQKANVSVATVSRVLNNSKRVSAELRQRVMEEVERYDYRPNFQARGLILDKSSLIGVIMPNISNIVQTSILEGIEQYVTDFGYQVMINNIGTSFLREKKGFQTMREWCIDGIILLHENTPDELSELLRIVEGIPIVLGSVNVQDCTLPSVGIDEERAAYDAVSYLARLGHRRIAGIFSSGHTLGTLRLSGYESALTDAGLPFDPACALHIDTCTPEGGVCAAKRLMQLPDRPTAVFCTNDEIAMGAMQHFIRHGLSVPGDISVIGFDDINFATLVTPRLTTIHQPIREIGTKAAQLLLAEIEAKTGGAQHLTLNHDLVIRDSCAPPRAKE